MKVLFIHNYSVDDDWLRWKTEKRTECPAYYLWGITHLENYGIEVDVLPYEKYSFLKKIGYAIKLGDLDHQLRIFLQQSKYDVIYSATQTGTVVLSLLSCLGLFRKPIIVKLERPFKVNFLSRIFVKIFARGHAKILCLSNRVRDQLKNEFGIDEEKIPIVDWGPDLSYYDNRKSKTKTNSDFFICAGSTSRDYNSLAKAFNTINYPLRIYCSEKCAPDAKYISPNITMQYKKNSVEPRALSFEKLIREYEKANAVAIPLKIPKHRVNNTTLIGLTNILEAMAMGKAIVMTKHRQANIDVEKEGIGLWVEPDDVNGWEKAISYLLEHPEETKIMGMKARQLCENKYNLDLFTSQIAIEIKKSVKR